MNQIELNNDTLILKVKKSNLFSRIILYLITILTIILPFGGFLLFTIDGGEVNFLSLIFLLLFGFIFIFMLRNSLWNTYGKEIIKISSHKLEYTADYNWFKDKVKEIDFKEIYFTVNKVGYENENKGVLVVNFNDDNTLETVTKIDIDSLNNLISLLNQNYN